MDNKYLWAIVAFVIGFYIAKKRMEKGIAKKIEDATDGAVTELAGEIDKALAIAQSKGLSVEQVRQVLNSANAA